MADIYEISELQMIIRPILQNYGISRAYLFGSYARGEATGNSDIDLRIDSDNIKSMFTLGALYEELTEALKKPVDLVTTNALEHKANIDRTKKFRDNIREDEKLIYEQNN
ncbi:MAG: nucleotidyltransferase [Eubacterium sp.]|jgi:predicted nucleotidyltransferase|nr:nucleotidyltransferase [Eubacterium sp.]